MLLYEEPLNGTLAARESSAPVASATCRPDIDGAVSSVTFASVSGRRWVVWAPCERIACRSSGTDSPQVRAHRASFDYPGLKKSVRPPTPRERHWP